MNVSDAEADLRDPGARPPHQGGGHRLLVGQPERREQRDQGGVHRAEPTRA